jgi:hypothetical protein
MKEYAMFSKSGAKKRTYQKPLTAVYLDFDEVINRSIEADQFGFIGGSVIGAMLLTELNVCCKKYHIPIYIITNRADNDSNQKHVASLIDQVGGFANETELGGFKKSNIRFLGIEARKHGKATLIAVHRTKIKEIDAIHESEFSFLKKSDQCVVDDDANNLTPITKAGYTTYLAEAKGDEHFKFVLEFVKAKVLASFLRTDPSSGTEGEQNLFQEDKQSSASSSEPTSGSKKVENYPYKEALYLKRKRGLKNEFVDAMSHKSEEPKTNVGSLTSVMRQRF